MAALGAPAREDSLAIFALHTSAESVGLGPFAVVRLKCSFRHCFDRNGLRTKRVRPCLVNFGWISLTSSIHRRETPECRPRRLTRMNELAVPLNVHWNTQDAAKSIGMDRA